MPRRAKKPTDTNKLDLQILPSPVAITQITFNRGLGPEEVEGDENVEMQLGFAANRVGPLAVRVQLSARSVSEGPHSLSVTSETVLTLNVPSGVDIDVDEHLAKVAGQLGPVVLYPYIREVVADITLRAGLEPITLPILQVGQLFTVAEDALRFEQPDKSKRGSRAGANGKQGATKKRSRKKSDTP